MSQDLYTNLLSNEFNLKKVQTSTACLWRFQRSFSQMIKACSKLTVKTNVMESLICKFSWRINSNWISELQTCQTWNKSNYETAVAVREFRFIRDSYISKKLIYSVKNLCHMCLMLVWCYSISILFCFLCQVSC